MPKKKLDLKTCLKKCMKEWSLMASSGVLAKRNLGNDVLNDCWCCQYVFENTKQKEGYHAVELDCRKCPLLPLWIANENIPLHYNAGSGEFAFLQYRKLVVMFACEKKKTSPYNLWRRTGTKYTSQDEALRKGYAFAIASFCQLELERIEALEKAKL